MDSVIAPDRHSAAAERVESSSVLVAKVSSKQVLNPSRIVLLPGRGPGRGRQQQLWRKL